MQEKNNALSSKHRLVQIVSILRKHKITQGIDPVKFRAILEELGPTFVKIGQIMSSRQDMFSQRYCEELIKLRESVTIMPFHMVEELIEEEYGMDIEDVFSSFEPHPLGSASIAQVHQAILKSDEAIVVKVQRPGIYNLMERDISLIRKASKLLHLNEVLGSVVNINIVLDEFWQTAKEEMDFLNEAAFAKRFAQNNENIQYIDAPNILVDYSTPHLLVMEYIKGYEITNIQDLGKEGYDQKEIALKLAENYIKQIVDDGFFHADPHPGNLRIRDGKIVWIDFGMMGSLSKDDKDLMKNAVLAIGNNDAQKLVDVILALGVHDGHMDYAMFYDDMETFMHKYIHMDLKDIKLGDSIQEIFTIAHKYQISMPKGISMLARGLVTMESTLALLDPEINIIQIAANHVSSNIFKHLDIKKELLKNSKRIYDAANYSLDLPVKLMDVMQMVMKGRLKLNLEIMDSSVPLKTIDHMVNKVTVGIVSAGLLMASSLLCTTNMTPKIFGIPALGFLGYITALGLGFWLLFTVLKEHRRSRKKH